MGSTHHDRGKAGKANPAAATQLDSLATQATQFFNDHLHEVIGRLVAAMTDVSDRNLDPRDVYQRVKSGNLLKNNSYAFLHLASTGLSLALKKEIAQLLPTAARNAMPRASELSLVSFEEIDQNVAFETLARPFELAHAAPLATLNVRLGFLLQRDILRMAQNPFRPEVFLRALNEAWREFEPDSEGHALLAPLLKPAILCDLAPMYESLCSALVKGQPGDVDDYNIRKTRSAAAAKSARERQQADLAGQLRRLLDGEGGAQALDELLVPELPASVLLPGGVSAAWATPAAGETAADAPAGAQQAPAKLASADKPVTAAHGMPLPAGAAAPVGAGLPGLGPLGHPAGANGMHVGLVHPAGSGVANLPAAPAASPMAPGMQLPPSMPHQGIVDGGGFAHPGLAATGPAAMPHAGMPPASGIGGASTPHPGFAGPPAAGDATPYPGFAPAQVAGVASGASVPWAGIPGIHSQVDTTLPLLDLLKRIHSHMPAPTAGAAAHDGSAPQAAPASAPAGDVFFLPRLKQSIPQGSLSRGDERTIDLLSKVFETVFIDPNLPSGIRELIQFLQVPVLRAALADKNFFFEEAHPARRMIELMSRMGVEQRTNPDDPLFQAMQRSVDKVGRDLDQSGEAFSAAVEELEQGIAKDDADTEQAIAAPIEAALKQERITVASRSARTAVAARIGSGQVVAMLETFLENKWTSVLTVAYSVEDKKPGAVSNATRTMDDLIWSVKPKITHEQRRELIAKLPGLLTGLNRWLDVIKWQDADRLQFFAELAETHASIVRAPLDISPERQLEIAVEVAQEDAMRRLEKEQAAAEAPEPEVDEAVLAVETLERGQWLEFDGIEASGADAADPIGTESRKVKLAWVSPQRTLMIFSTGARKEAFSMQADRLVELFRQGRVRILHADGVVSRALTDALQQMASNDPHGGAAHPAAA